MSACHNSTVLTLVETKSLCSTGTGVESLTGLFVISRSSVRNRALALYIEKLRGGAVAARLAHNHQVAGSSPAPAINEVGECLG